MTEVDIKYLKERAGRETNGHHVRKFVPMIEPTIKAIEAAVGKANVEPRNKNQIKILGRFVGKFEHGILAVEGFSHFGIFDGSEQSPMVSLRTMRDVEVFAATNIWLKAAIREMLED